MINLMERKKGHGIKISVTFGKILLFFFYISALYLANQDLIFFNLNPLNFLPNPKNPEPGFTSFLLLANPEN